MCIGRQAYGTAFGETRGSADYTELVTQRLIASLVFFHRNFYVQRSFPNSCSKWAIICGKRYPVLWCFRNSLQRVYFYGSCILPKAKAHGNGQNACARV